jgi:Mrp family chromosome partitioning ATPase
LFVDADMRRGYTHKMFNYQPENGLSDILSGKIEFAMQQSRLQLQDLTLFLEDRYHQIQPNY